MVSIPSKRESALQVNMQFLDEWQNNRFNSLQTGKCLARQSKIDLGKAVIHRVSIPSKRESAWQVDVPIDPDTGVEFQFPPNGKVLGKALTIVLALKAVATFVSIPSKRESALQEVLFCVAVGVMLKSFNSLQTGKCFARIRCGC